MSSVISHKTTQFIFKTHYSSLLIAFQSCHWRVPLLDWENVTSFAQPLFSQGSGWNFGVLWNEHHLGIWEPYELDQVRSGSTDPLLHRCWWRHLRELNKEKKTRLRRHYLCLLRSHHMTHTVYGTLQVAVMGSQRSLIEVIDVTKKPSVETCKATHNL